MSKKTYKADDTNDISSMIESMGLLSGNAIELTKMIVEKDTNIKTKEDIIETYQDTFHLIMNGFETIG